jgi:hypothetical protein
LQRFESLLLTPATILGTPTEAGLNQKNSSVLLMTIKNVSLPEAQRVFSDHY